jgi:hypothetical protein
MLLSQTSVALRTSGLGMLTGVESQPLHYIELIEAGRYCTYKVKKTGVECLRIAAREKQ